jgi:eukaryotic-like serine/threonine-protein kinase
MSAADKMLGLDLTGGWKVVQKLQHQGTSGGYFSVPYIAKDQNGKVHFLKAFDFSTAFQPGADVIKELQQLTAAFEHERDILEHCKSRRLSGVVVAVTHGYVQIPGMPPQEGTVYYLIFERADGDVRRQVDNTNRLELLWCLRILDDVTLGLMQVHREAIAHQDLKPSNVLIYDKNCRIGDFGRSSRRGRQMWVDDLDVAGDTTYAPPELLYSYRHPDFVCDLSGFCVKSCLNGFQKLTIAFDKAGEKRVVDSFVERA